MAGWSPRRFFVLGEGIARQPLLAAEERSFLSICIPTIIVWGFVATDWWVRSSRVPLLFIHLTHLSTDTCLFAMAGWVAGWLVDLSAVRSFGQLSVSVQIQVRNRKTAGWLMRIWLADGHTQWTAIPYVDPCHEGRQTTSGME